MSSGVTGERQGGTLPPRDIPPGNFWQLIGENEARKKGKKMWNVEENEEKWIKEGWKSGFFFKKNEKGRRKMRKCKVKNDWKKLRTFLLFTFSRYTNVAISTGKRLKSRWKKLGIETLPPQKTFPVTPLHIREMKFSEFSALHPKFGSKIMKIFSSLDLTLQENKISSLVPHFVA